jgi:tetratricopeptide (TPR) repeat protein
VPGIPAALEAVCLKAMAKDPAQRYGSAKELAGDVQHWLADEPVAAYCEPLTVRTGRWMRHHRVLVMASVTALLVGAAALGVATVLLSAKNDELRRANDAEAEAFRQAQANFEMASQAVEDYLFNVADDDRLKERDLAELRKKLVASAATFYQKFIASRQEDPQVALMLGRAYSNLGRVHHELSENNDAVEKYRQAQAVFQRLTELDRDEPEYGYYLGLAHLDLEWVYRFDQQRYDEAEKEWAKAMPVFEQLARQHPAVKKYRSKETECVLRRSYLLNARGHPDQAEPFCRRSVAMRRQMVQDFPDIEEQDDLSRGLAILGKLLNNLNRQKEANQALEEAIRINKDVVLAAPRVPRYRFRTAWLYGELMWTLRGLGQPQAAEDAIRKAVEVNRQLVANFPGVPSYQDDLVENLRLLVEGLTDAGKIPEAVALGYEAVRLGDKLVAQYPKEPSFRKNLAQAVYALARALHKDGAIAEGEKLRRRSIDLFAELTREHPGVPFYWEGLGTGHSGLAFVLMNSKRLPESKEENMRALAVFEKLAKDYPRMADYSFRIAETCANLSGTLALLGEPNDEVIKKGIAAVEPLLRSGSNTRYERVYARLKKQPSFSAPHTPGTVLVASLAPTTLQGELTKDDPLDVTFPPTQKSYHKVHLITMKAGKHYQIDLAADFDTFLRLEDQKQVRLLFNDDVTHPDNLNSRVIFSCKVTTTYCVIVTSFKPGITGPYTLKVQEAVPEGLPQVIKGKLTEQDDDLKGRYGKRQKVELQAGLAHVIEVQSPDYDARISLGDATGKQTVGKSIVINTNKKQVSRVDFTPGQTGAYTLFLTTAQPGQTGAYTIRIQAYKLAGP